MERLEMVNRLLAVALASVGLSACADSKPMTTGPEFSRSAAAAAAKSPSSQDFNTTFTLSNSTALALRGDGKYLNATGESQYANGTCGVYSKVFIDNGGGDAIMYTTDAQHADRKCPNYPRKVYLAGKTNALVDVQLRVQGLGLIPIGAAEDHFMSVIPSTGACARYDFGNNAGGDRVSVTRTGQNTWVVQSQPAPNNRAVCVSDGSGPYALDISFVVQRQ
jgi:hypothetical protein